MRLKLSLTLSTYLSPTAAEFVEQEAQKNTCKPSIFDSLPIEMILQIFAFFQPKDLCQTALVCRHWEKLSLDDSIWKKFDLKMKFPFLEIIDQKAFEEEMDLKNLCVSFSNACLPLARVVMKVIAKMSKLELEEPGITLLTLPEGLSLQMVKDIAAKHNFTFSYPDPKAIQTVAKTCRLLITNHSIKGCTGFSLEQHQEVLKEKCFEMPDAMSMFVIGLFNAIKMKKNSEKRKLKVPRDVKAKIIYNPYQFSHFFRCFNPFGDEKIILSKTCFEVYYTSRTSLLAGVRAMWKFS